MTLLLVIAGSVSRFVVVSCDFKQKTEDFGFFAWGEFSTLLECRRPFGSLNSETSSPLGWFVQIARTVARVSELSQCCVSAFVGLLLEEFLKSTASQLTVPGLCELSEHLREGQLAILFRNNHFNTIYKKEVCCHCSIDYTVLLGSLCPNCAEKKA